MPADRTLATEEPTELISAALYDWWTTADPGTQFHAPDVADHVSATLAHHGYTITRATSTTPIPTRLNIITGALIAFLAALSTAFAIRLDLWIWAGIGACVTVLTTHETVVDFTTRLISRRNQHR
ncbi:hypothetical protein [Streptomyces sp. NPDC005281]|uniref:hypothetical protein n=1 Tax=Streptomyces sp. NPDC005281 TaxID=3155712 RepID=UPI0033B39BE5